MIIMINGTFGVGKTTTAELLNQALTNSMTFDPEEAGAIIRKITQGICVGNEYTDDYQDIIL